MQDEDTILVVTKQLSRPTIARKPVLPQLPTTRLHTEILPTYLVPFARTLGYVGHLHQRAARGGALSLLNDGQDNVTQKRKGH